MPSSDIDDGADSSEKDKSLHDHDVSFFSRMFCFLLSWSLMISFFVEDQTHME